MMGKNNRCVMYLLDGEDGIADGYIFRMLDALSLVSTRMLFLTCSELSPQTKEALNERGAEILYGGQGDSAYDLCKRGIESVGFKELETYDEAVFLNSFVMGPVYPLSEMFDAMAERTLDFWDLTKDADPFFFKVFRKRLLASYEFRYFWTHLKEGVIKEGIICEDVLVRYFSEMGFAWGAYLDPEGREPWQGDSLLYHPKELIEKRRCPVFDKRTFTEDYTHVLQKTCGQAAMELYDHLREQELYDTDLLWDHLLRTCNMNDLFKNMHLDYVLPGEYSHADRMREVMREKKTAAVVHIYFLDLLDETYRYVSHLPDICDIYITTGTEKNKSAIEEKFADMRSHRIEVRTIENRGRDVASILVGVKDVAAKYEYLCFVHDKKSAQMTREAGESFQYKCFENTLYSEDYIYNIIETFEKNPRLGILCPPEPNHADYSVVIGMSWGQNRNYEITKKLAEEMNITVPMDPAKDAVAPFGSFFWFRYEALKAFYERGWEYDDFPEEPLPADGTISHAIERLRPFVAQQAGYYTAYVMTDRFARIEYSNLHAYVENFNKACFDNGYIGFHDRMVQYLGELVAQSQG